MCSPQDCEAVEVGRCGAEYFKPATLHRQEWQWTDLQWYVNAFVLFNCDLIIHIIQLKYYFLSYF